MQQQRKYSNEEVLNPHPHVVCSDVELLQDFKLCAIINLRFVIVDLWLARLQRDFVLIFEDQLTLREADRLYPGYR
jgi:hypothetical protein